MIPPVAAAPTPPAQDLPDDVFVRASAFVADAPLPKLPAPPPADRRPLLTLDPGGHTSFVKHLFFTPAADRVISVSDDKSIRVWDVATGESVQTIRLPAGPAEDGALLAAALSPDGKRLAVGGVPVGLGKSGFPIYLVSPDTGALEKVLIGAKNIVHALDFSADGTRLAVGCGDGTVQIMDVAEGKIVYTATVNPGIIREIRLHPTRPRIVTLADGVVHLWDMETADRPIATITLTNEKPHCVAWMGNGQKFGIGCVNGEVRLHDADGKRVAILPTAYEPDTNGVIQVGRMKFLPEDKEIVYGGISHRGWAGVIDVATGKRRLQLTEHSNTVFAINVSADGRFAVSTGGENNETLVWKTADGTVVQKFEGGGRSLWAVAWSPDGKSLAWGRTNLKNSTGFCPLDTELNLTDWTLGDSDNPLHYQRALLVDDVYTVEPRDFYTFGVRGGRRKNDDGTYGPDRGLYVYKSQPEGNRIYSTTLLPGQGKIVVGGSGTLDLIDARNAASLRKYVGATGLTTALAPSPDGRFFASVSTDQTIRLWAVDRDEPVLSIYQSGREWIAWTPEGYYASSAGGERLIGWQVSNGFDKLPTVHPAVRFRASLFQPSLIKYLVPAGNLPRALAMVGRYERRQLAASSLVEVLPPAASIVSPAGPQFALANEVLTVRASAEGTEKHPVSSLRLVVDGRPFQGALGVKRFDHPTAKAQGEWQVPLPPGVHSVAVLAESSVSQALSRPVVVTRAGTAAQSNLFVLAVGVADYADEASRLRFANTDALLLADTLETKAKGLFGKVETKIVTNRGATRAGILAGLDWLKNKMTANDVGVFFFSGHGTRDPLGRFYLVPVDYSTGNLAGSCVSGDLLKRRLEDMPGKLVAVLDACHSGAAANPRRPAARPDALVRDLVTEECGVVVLCSSLGREFSIESTETKAGFFTLGLVEGLNGKADLNKDGFVFVHELEAYAAARVAQLSGGAQHPIAGRPPNIRLFPIARP